MDDYYEDDFEADDATPPATPADPVAPVAAPYGASSPQGYGGGGDYYETQSLNTKFKRKV